MTERQRIGDCYLIRFDRPLVCFNAFHLQKELRQIPSGVSDIVLHFGDRVSLIDHTTCEYLLNFVDEHRKSVGWVEMIGIERLIPRSPAETSMRLAPAQGSGRGGVRRSSVKIEAGLIKSRSCLEFAFVPVSLTGLPSPFGASLRSLAAVRNVAFPAPEGQQLNSPGRVARGFTIPARWAWGMRDASAEETLDALGPVLLTRLVRDSPSENGLRGSRPSCKNQGRGLRASGT